MLLVCVNAFGNFVPGDEVEVPDGALFDTAYFRVKPDAEPADDGAEGNGDETEAKEGK